MLPLLFIQILLAFCAPPVVAATPPPAPTPAIGASNISANGFPNCNKSSDAFVPPAAPLPLVAAAAPAAVAGVAPNRSTIGAPAPLAGGDDKNGFVNAAPAPAPPPPAVGEETLDCWKRK